jgi:hypothetical protein
MCLILAPSVGEDINDNLFIEEEKQISVIVQRLINKEKMSSFH